MLADPEVTSVACHHQVLTHRVYKKPHFPPDSFFSCKHAGRIPPLEWVQHLRSIYIYISLDISSFNILLLHLSTFEKAG